METNKFYTLEEYAGRINISVWDLAGESRKHKFSTPRQVYWYYLFENKIPLVAISNEFNRSHTTIIHGIRTVKGLMEVKDRTINPYLKALDIFSL